jgi:hypothetical protein
MKNKERFAKIALYVPAGLGNKAATMLSTCDVRHSVSVWDGHGVKRTYDELTPTSNGPAVEPFYIHWGGGRTYGGGFSKEAQRRAKRKQR